MTRRLLALSLVALATAGPARAVDPVTAYFASKLSEALFDKVTGQPNINEIQKRLMELEKSAATRAEMTLEIQRVRTSLDAKASKAEVEAALGKLRDNLSQIKARVDAVEQDLEETKVRLDDKDNGTSYAKSPAHFLKRAEELAAKDDRFRALANLGVALKLSPKYTPAYVARAKVFRQAGQPEIADIDLNNAIEAEPDDLDALRLRAAVRNELGRFAEARSDAEAILKAKPGDFEAAYQLASALHSLKLWGDAEKAYRACAALEPESQKVWANLGSAALEAKNLTLALEALDKAVKINPETPTPLWLRSLALLRTKRYAEALADADKYLSKDGDDPVALGVRGAARYELGQKNDALADLRKSAEKNSGEPHVHWCLGRESLAAADHGKAFDHLNAAVTLGGDHPLMGRDLGIAYYYKKDFVNAVKFLTPYATSGDDTKERGRALFFRAMARHDSSELKSVTDGWDERVQFRDDLSAAINLDPTLQERRSSGDVFIVNSSKADIVIDPDFWIQPDGERYKVRDWYNYKFAAGTSRYFAFDKKMIEARRIQLVVEYGGKSVKILKEYKSGTDLRFEVTDADLPK